MAAAHGEPPPPELKLWWWCKDLNTPPEEGGVLDQDEKLMHTMRALDNIYTAVSRFFGLKGDQIHRLTDNERRILRMLKDNGFLFT